MSREHQRAAGQELLRIAGVGGLNTLNALRPLVRDGNGVIPVMAASMLTSEFPLHALALQNLATGRALRRGALLSLGGAAGAAVAVASSLGLISLHREASRSVRVLDDVLDEALGPSHRARVVTPRPESSHRSLSKVELVLPRRGNPRRHIAQRDVAYGSNGRRNLLDIWRHPDLSATDRAPVIVQVHGGGWVTGDKRGQAQPLLSHLAERGWVGASVTYRRGRQAGWPAHIVDVKRAVAWVKANIADFGGDPDFIAITGGSAGGHLAALAALTANDPAFQPGFEELDTTLQAAAPFYGVYDFVDDDHLGIPAGERFFEQRVFGSALQDEREQWAAASPLHRVRADAPPFFILHGDNDVFARVEQARYFAASLAKVSEQPVAYAELPRAQHAFEIFASVRATAAVAAVARFLEVVYGDSRRG